MLRKIVPALVAPLLLVAACASEGDEGAVEVKTGAEAVSALRAAPDAAAEAGTASFEMVMAMSFEGESFELTATGAYDAEAQRMSMSMDMGAMFDELAEASGETVPEGLDGAMELVAEGDTFYMRAPMFSVLTGDAGWLSLSPEDLGVSADAFGPGVGAYDPSKMLESLRGVTGEPEAVGTEEVRGVDTTHYRASMDLEQALAAAPADQREALEQQLRMLGDMSDADFPVDVWVDADGLPRRMQMDMGALLAGLGEDGSMRMTMEFFDYGEPVSIEIPSPDEVSSFKDAMGGLGGFGADAS